MGHTTTGVSLLCVKDVKIRKLPGGIVMNTKTRKLIFTAVLAAIGYVLTPIFRIPGWAAPMQHLINVTGVVLLGPAYGFACSALLTAMKLILMGEDLFSIPGGLIGAFLAGVMYKKFGKIWAAAIGEIFGTGILGAMCSYPLSAFYYGNAGVSLFTYIPAFMISTCFGTLCAVILLKFMRKAGVLRKLQGEAEGETTK